MATDPRPPRSFPRDLLVIALLVVAVTAALLFRPGRSVAPDPAAAVDSCFTYGGEPRHVERTVSCDQPHDGRVLSTADAATSCPAGTDAVLTGDKDAAATAGVLCISEHS